MTCPELKSSYWEPMPLKGTQEQIKEWRNVLFSDQRFGNIIVRVPQSETFAFKPTPFSDLQIKAMVAFNRISNRICNHCLDKKDVAILKWCTSCEMTFYCSKECLSKAFINDWPKHSQWCCRLTALPDNGPNMTVLVNVAHPTKSSSTN